MVLLSVLSGALYNILLYRTDTVKTTYDNSFFIIE